MLRTVESIVAARAADRSARFVFPSEICAEAWLERSLRLGLGGMRAAEAGRFLGWDGLKEAAASAGPKPPADEALRRVYASALLADNERRPFLTRVIPPEHAAQRRSFEGYVAARLSALGGLPAALAAAPRGTAADPEAADWLAIRTRYAAFLASVGRIEPSYEPLSLRLPSGPTAIFFPALIEDFEDYRAALERGSASGSPVTLVDIPSGPPAPRLRRPPTALAELRETLSEIGRLLDAGVEAGEIAITVAGLDAYLPYLEREAALLSIPIVARSGSSLAASPGGRFFAALRDAHSSGCSYDSLRDLLSPAARPWKDRDVIRALLAAGRRLHAVASWPEAGGRDGRRRVDVWERSLSGQTLAWYRELKRFLDALVGAPDFASLLKAYNAFKVRFLDATGWDEAADLTLARCVVEIEELGRAQALSGLSVDDAYPILMRALESRRYVPAGPRAGVPVYAWRVAAGIAPERHYVLGASQNALAIPSRVFDFLGEGLRRKLAAAHYRDPGAADRDAAPDFITAYAHSGARVLFSCPETGWSGEQAEHGFLARHAAEEPPAEVDDSYRREAAWLALSVPAPERLHRLQAAGIAAAAEAGPAGAAGNRGAFLESPNAARVFALLSRGAEASKPGLDATAIDAYHRCPYAYLYLRLLGAETEPSGIEFADAIFLGDVYHAALETLFSLIREADGRFRPERLDAYRELVGPCLDEAFARLARERGAFVAVVLDAYRGRLEAYLAHFLAAEAKRFPGLEIEALEESLELEYPELAGGIVLRGRIDRLSRSERGLVLVDYKKGGIPKKAEVAPDESGSIAKAQLPCYLRLAAARGSPEALRDPSSGPQPAGNRIDSAWYLSIEGDAQRESGSGSCAFGDDDDAYVGRDDLGPLLAAFDAALARTAEGVAAGEFPFAAKRDQAVACAECGARGICRERYALRFGAAPGGGRERAGGGRP